MSIQDQVDRLIVRAGRGASILRARRARVPDQRLHPPLERNERELSDRDARGARDREHRHGWEAPHHKRLFDAILPGPTPYIITTQGHVDHVGGVALFREPGTRYVAQR